MGTMTDEAQRPAGAEGRFDAAPARPVQYPARAPIVDADGLLRGFELHLREVPVAEGDEPDAPAEPRLDVSCYHVEFPFADVAAITDRVRRFNRGEPVKHEPATWATVSLPSLEA